MGIGNVHGVQEYGLCKAVLKISKIPLRQSFFG
jgi:hypothetical protein